MNLGQRIEALQRQRANLLDGMQRMHELAAKSNRNMSPAEEMEFATAADDVAALDASLKELLDQEREHGRTAQPIGDQERGIYVDARALPPGKRFDVAPLAKALARSGNWTAAATVCKTVLQGAGAGALGATRTEASVLAMGWLWRRAARAGGADHPLRRGGVLLQPPARLRRARSSRQKVRPRPACCSKATPRR